MASVRFKGVAEGLCLIVDPEASFQTIKEEVKKLFDPLKEKARPTKVSLDLGQRADSEQIVADIEQFLADQYHVESVTPLPPKKEPRPAGHQEERMTHASKRRADSLYHRQSDVLLLTGRVRSGQKISAKNHLMILGDVNPGAEVLAGGDIYILGTLSGTAAAGQPNNENAIVLALNFRPIQVQIAGVVAAGLPSDPGVQAEYASVDNKTIVVQEYLKNNPFGKIPWPTVR